jgi:Icc-related predicted phosphoesterase
MGNSVRITHIEDALLGEVHYLNASPRGGTGVERLPITCARVGALGGDLDAVIACSDLQGIVPGRDGVAELLGVRVAEVLEELAFDGVIPPTERTGVILAGDLYSVPEANKRGGYGDVAEVWRAFADRFAWVAGVAGNHDDITNVTAIDGVHLLDGEVVALDAIRIGGVGGIIGNPRKPGRRDEDAQLELLTRVLDAGVDILVLHEGPNGDDRNQPGSTVLREAIEAIGVGLVICGHDHWREPLASRSSIPILNVDTRVVVLRTGQ